MRDEIENESVLIVEDDPYFSGRIAGIVKEINPDWQIFTKSNGKSAIKLITETSAFFNLALVDIGLPDVSGLDVIKAFHAKFPETPVLVLSVISVENTVFKAMPVVNFQGNNRNIPGGN